ncbi:665_t:CDS:2, partial [Scutellospora calospora]
KAPLKPRLPLSKNSKNTDDRVVLYKRRAAKSPTMAFNLGNLSEDNTDEENEPIQYQNETEISDILVRRSKRQRIKPLEFWRNERIVYGPTRTKVIRVPRPEDNGKQKKSGAGRDTKKRKRGNKKTTSNKNETDDEDIDEASSAEGLAIDWETKEKVARRVIYTLSMYQTEPIDNDGCRFQKTFSEGDFFSAGLIDIPKGRKKSGRNSNENAM